MRGTSADLEKNIEGGPENRHDRRQRYRQLAVFCFGIWLHAAHSMLVATTLPSAIQDIGGAGLVAWAFILYQLGSILAGTATGQLVLRHGIRRLLLVAATVYGIGCLLCAVAPAMPLLLSGRLLQGFGGGALVALAYVALERLFPAHLMPRLVALYSVIWSGAAFCGPLIGGSFAAAGHWRTAFWIFAAQAAALVLAGTIVVKTPDKQEGAPVFGSASSHSLPTGRLGLLAAAIISIGLVGLYPQGLIGPSLAVLGIGLFRAFLRIDAHAGPRRLLPSRLFDPRTVVGLGICGVVLASLATMSFLVYGPLLLTELYGVSPLTAGYLVAVESVAWGAAAFLVARVPPSGEATLIRLGSLMILAGLAGFSVVVPWGPFWAIPICALLQGAGFGLMWGFLVRRIVDAVQPAERPLAAAALPTIQQIGFAIGAALCGIVANLAGFNDAMTRSHMISVAAWVFAAFVPVAMLAVLNIWRFARR